MADEPSADVQALLTAMESMDVPQLHELDPSEARTMMAELRPGGDPAGEVAAVEDRTIPGPAGEIPVRVYTPTGDGPHPVVVYFHGGGFVLGDLDGHDDPCRVLAEDAETVVVSVDYRLAPEHPFPAAVEDAYAATTWVVDHADDLGADPDRLAVAGDSAGGNLATVVALAARDRNGPELAYQVLFYPVVDFDDDAAYPSLSENAEGYFLTADDMTYFHDHYVPSWVHQPNPYLSPIEAESHADLPPATVVTMGFDPLRDEGRAYVDALEADGTPVTHRGYDDLIHGVVSMIREPMAVAGGRDVLDDVAGDLRDALH